MQKVLVISYSQTGQLSEIIESLIAPLGEDEEIEVTWQKLRPVTPYAFPWSIVKFLDVFPESVTMEPVPLEPVTFDADADYALVILGYQVWYLSPSLPVVGFLKSPDARVLNGKPVITVIGCRDMWLMAQEKTKGLLQELGARLIDNLVLTDQGKKIFTFVTTPRWLIWGKKKSFWRIFPPAGVSDRDIQGARSFGNAIVQGLKSGEVKKGGPVLSGLGAVSVDPNNIKLEDVAHRGFLFWARLIKAVGAPGEIRRYPFLFLFVAYLGLMILLGIFVGIPLVLLEKIFSRGAGEKALLEKKKYYEAPSGSSRERLDSL